jgi:hypothetical protein
MNFRTAILSVAGLLVSATVASADVYTSANFSGGIFGGAANVQGAFVGFLSPSQTFNGHLVFDNALVPAANTNFVNVGFASFPDSAAIPPATAFAFSIGQFSFNLSNDPLAAIQYNHGKFNGFAANESFTFQGNQYDFLLSGGTWSIFSAPGGNPAGGPLVNGYINIGNAGLTNQVPFTTVVAGVPEPSTWAMMILGFAGIGAMTYRRRRTATLAA